MLNPGIKMKNKTFVIMICKITVRNVTVFDGKKWFDVIMDIDIPDEEIYLNVRGQLW